MEKKRRTPREERGRLRLFASPVRFFVKTDASGHFRRKWHYPGKLAGGGNAAMSNRGSIRASEIGDWCFCRRAWYLANRNTQPSLLQIERRQAGTAYHERHGRVVMQPRRTISAENIVLLLLLLFVFAYWLTLRTC